MIIEGTSWDDLATRMFTCGVVMGWGAATPSETYYLYRSEGALLDDYYNPEGYMDPVTDGYLQAAMEATTVEEAYKNWQLVQWDGQTGTAMQGNCPWVWIVNLDHIYFVRDGLSIGGQPIHPHGHSIPLIRTCRTGPGRNNEQAGISGFRRVCLRDCRKTRRGFPTNFGSLLRAEFVPWKGTNSTLAA